MSGKFDRSLPISTVEHKFSVFNDLCGKVLISKNWGGNKDEQTKENRYVFGEGNVQVRRDFCATGIRTCRGQYYQPKEPDNMKLFVAKCQGKNV